MRIVRAVNGKFRIHGWLVLTVLLTVFAGRATQTAWGHLRRFQVVLRRTRTDSFHVAEHVMQRLDQLNQEVDRTETTTHLENELQGINSLLASNKLMVTTAEQVALLDQINNAFADYFHKAKALMQTPSQQGQDAGHPISQDLAKEAATILSLAELLRVSEQVALKSFVEDVEQSSDAMKQQMVYSAILTLILGIVAARSIYLVKVTPLRSELEQSRALLERQEKLASLGIMAAGVAHEIRNPLAAIKVRLLGPKRALAGDLANMEELAVVEEEVRRVDAIVTNFLQFARPAEPAMQLVEIRRLFLSVRRLLEPHLSNKTIDLKIDCPSSALVRADPHQMEQVILNLALNAVESIEGNGVVTLKGWPQRPGTALTFLQVVDTGKGIPPDVQKRLFDPFFTTKEKGTGLGLSIAARIVEKHRGFLKYHTELERGTTFTVELPCNG